MDGISRSVVKRDHDAKAEGRSIYVSDHRTARDGRPILAGKLLVSSKARARVLAVHVPSLPSGYFYVDEKDIPGENKVIMITDDTPVFSRGTVEYIGEAIGMVVGPDEEQAQRIVSGIRVDYEELEPVLDIEDATLTFGGHDFGFGDPEKAFAEADKVYEAEFRTGYQEQAYLEPQGMTAEPEADGSMFIHGSCQGVYSPMEALPAVLGCPADRIHVLQDTTGGGFGGKQSFPTVLACQVAVAAKKANAPVRCVYTRREDLSYTYKRHPSLCRFKMAVRDGRVTGLDAEILLNGGAYKTLSMPVLERALSCAAGVYLFPNVHVSGYAVRTNTVPNDAFRGFGGPQAFFAIERMMDRIARDLGEDPLSFREAHLARQGDPTVTNGRFHFPVPLPEMIAKADEASHFRQKYMEYSRPQTGRFRRGIGVSLVMHGDAFTGTEERDIVKGTVRLRKDENGMVEVLAASGEIGQGVRTTFPKIVAQELGIPLERVFYDMPDTARVPDSGPTSASRSVMIVGELLRRAAARLKECWKDGVSQEIEEDYREPDHTIPFNFQTFQGDAYPAYAWSVSVIEAEADTLTGEVKVVRALGCFDVGTPIDENIVIGQMEGGFLQGIGQAAMEKMETDEQGRIIQATMSDYLIPTTLDVPDMEVMLHVQEYPEGPFGAKGAGELPLVGAAPAYVSAVEQALGGKDRFLRHSPFTAEDVMAELSRKGDGANG